MSKGGSTQLRATARSSSPPPTSALAGRASAARRGRASRTAPTPRTYDVLPPCTAALARRARTASQASASAGEHRALQRAATAGGVRRARWRRTRTTVMPSTGSSGRQPGAAYGQVRQRPVPTSPATMPGEPRQDQQRAVAVDGRQRGEQVLPAEDRLVGDPGERASPGQHRGVAQRAQAQRSAEQEEHDQRRSRRPR